MNIILLERVPNLGHLGDVVRVKDGYARNFLLPRGKALRATKANLDHFASQRTAIEERNMKARTAAGSIAGQLDGQMIVIIRQAGEMGQLYGSVAARDIAEQVVAQGHAVNRTQIALNAPIKTLGLHRVPVHLHAEVDVGITVNVARSPEEAERQARGESATIREEINLDDLGLEVGAALNEAGGSLGD
ncbi:MAG: 50S ribosomal protein L9 [Hyphomicrobiales bacterium]